MRETGFFLLWALLAVVLPAAAAVGQCDVDFNGWSWEGYIGGHTSLPNWSVSGDGRSVTQTANSDPSFFFDHVRVSTNMVIECTVGVMSSVDDDTFGFALGFNPGDTSNAEADYFVIAWKQALQQCLPRGFRFLRVRGIPVTCEFSGISDPDNTQGHVEELCADNLYREAGWVNRQEYRFRFEIGTDDLRVYIDGGEMCVIRSEDGIPPGRFTLFCQSQEQTRFRDLQVWSVTAFTRGDCNGDGQTCGGIADALFFLQWMFQHGDTPFCETACDANADGKLDVADAVYYLGYCFLGTTQPPAPFPECGVDLGCLSCEAYSACEG